MLFPICTYESATLVRVLYRVSCYLNTVVRRGWGGGGGRVHGKCIANLLFLVLTVFQSTKDHH